jgi:hypothetical protein
MEQTETKEIIKEALNILKDKIGQSFDSGADEGVDTDIESITNMLANLIDKLEEFAFDSGRSVEEDGQYTFADFTDFKETMNGD